VKPGATDVSDTRLDPCEETQELKAALLLVRLTAVFGGADGIDGENVKGDVDPFVVTQPYEGKKLVVSHVLCMVTVITSVQSATIRIHVNAAAALHYLARECSKIWCKQCPTRKPRELATSYSSTVELASYRY